MYQRQQAEGLTIGVDNLVDGDTIFRLVRSG